MARGRRSNDRWGRSEGSGPVINIRRFTFKDKGRMTYRDVVIFFHNVNCSITSFIRTLFARFPVTGPDMCDSICLGNGNKVVRCSREP